MTPIIYADFNDFEASGILPLTCRGSIESLRSLAIVEGLAVLLSDGQLFARAVLYIADNGVVEARDVMFLPEL